MEYVLVGAAALVVGALVGFVARSTWSSQAMKHARENADRLTAEAATRQKELIVEAKEEKIRLLREAEDEVRAKRQEMTNLDVVCSPATSSSTSAPTTSRSENRKLVERERELDHQRDELSRLNQERIVALERVSGMSGDDAKAMLLEAVREEAEHDAVKLARAIERQAREEAQDKARDIIVTAMQRIAADHTAEHTVSVVHLPSDEMKGRIIGREGRNIRALEQATGVDLIIDDTPETVILSGFDPVRREIARIALTKLIQDGRIHPGRIEEVVAKARAEVELDDPPGRRAGRLRRWRAGPAAGARASSSGASSTAPATARTCSSTSSRPAASRRSSPREIGRRHQDRQDRRAAARHRQGGRPRGRGPARRDRGADRPAPRPADQGRQRHRRAPPGGGVRVSSRRSSCRSPTRSARRRPGARGETMETYIKRLEELQGIANSFPGVEKSFAIQAGREVRILVRPDEIDDLAASRLARDIVKKIEETLAYPGQIKVTVIRETRAVEYAK